MPEGIGGRSELWLALAAIVLIALTLREAVPIVLKRLINGKGGPEGNGGASERRRGYAQLEIQVAANRKAIETLAEEIRDQSKDMVRIERTMATREDVDGLRQRYEQDVSTTMRQILKGIRAVGARGGGIATTPPEGSSKL